MELKHHKIICTSITQLLQTEGFVSIPEIGGFMLSAKEALPAMGNHKFFPPATKISFSQKFKQQSLPLIQLISEGEHIPIYQAKTILLEWVNAAKEQLNTLHKLHIDGVGILHLNHHNIEFSQQLSTPLIVKELYGLPVISLKQINKHEQQEHRQRSMVYKVAFIGLLIANLLLIGTLVQQKSGQTFASISEITQKLSFNTHPSEGVYRPRNVNSNFKIDALFSVEYDVLASQLDSLRKPIFLAPTSMEESPYDTSFAYLIKGCFKDKNNASNLALSYTLKGVDAGVIRHKGLYKVFVGKSKDKEHIWNALFSVQQELGADIWVLAN